MMAKSSQLIGPREDFVRVLVVVMMVRFSAGGYDELVPLDFVGLKWGGEEEEQRRTELSNHSNVRKTSHFRLV